MIRKLRLLFILLLVLDLCVLAYLGVQWMDNSVPDHVFTYKGKNSQIALPYGFGTEESKAVLQVTNQEDGFSVVAEEEGQYQVPVKLFGVVPVKNVNVSVIEDMKLAPSGEPIGIYVETNGLLVLDTAEIEGRDGLTYAPGENVIKTGDYLLQWNHNTISTISQLNEEIQKTKDKKVPVTIRRNGEKMDVALRPILATDRTYKIGTWVREDTQGIGTLTYVTENGEFGTLGHGITDADTGDLLNLQGGEMYRTKILGITKGQSGEPGELQGYINMVADNEIGKIKVNSHLGVFGRIDRKKSEGYHGEYMPVGVKQEIKKGKAYIYANLEGTARKYEIEIEEISLNSKNNKCMIIHITDQRLLSLTGGIVQGMSGSPIIQNGKIIGAVTHVLVDDPTRGYGIFIENMLEH